MNRDQGMKTLPLKKGVICAHSSLMPFHNISKVLLQHMAMLIPSCAYRILL